MKYESNILERLIKTYGVVGNPKYVSEIIKQFIIQGKECYPNLFTYQSDWLAHIDEFGLANDYVVTYTGQRFYAPNTKESPVKRAILKGNTLLVDELGNECEIPNSPKITMGAWINTNTGVETASVTSFNTGFLKCPTVPFVVKGNNKYKRIVFYDENKTFISGIDTKVSNNSDVTIASTKIPSNAFYLRISASSNTEGVSYTPDTKLLIEDVSGNNLYSTQLVSVKMPVLTTVGKNLFSCSLMMGLWHTTQNKPILNDKYFCTTDLIRVHPNTIVKVSGTAFNPEASGNVFFYDKDKNYLGNDAQVWVLNKAKIPSNAHYMAFHFVVSNLYDINGTVQIEIVDNVSSPTTAYEPYKTNILTVNEDVTLRGVGNVKDELDLLTGEVTNRIGEIVLDGSSDEKYAINGYTTEGLTRFVINSISNRKQKGNTISNVLPIVDNSNAYGLFSGIGLNIMNNCSTVDDLRIWLQQNPITIQYELETESIKTVDLNIKDQNNQVVNHLTSFEGGTHFDTSSQTGSVLPTLEVDVVVDLEETLKTCSLEGNTM